jgi:hypothetical protein
MLIGNSVGKRPLGETYEWMGENTKLDLTSYTFKMIPKDVGYDDADWIHQAKDLVQWRALCIYLFICGLLNEPVNSPHYIELNRVMISE